MEGGTDGNTFSVKRYCFDFGNKWRMYSHNRIPLKKKIRVNTYSRELEVVEAWY